MIQPDLWREEERRRLVRLCAALSGDRDAAEDLAQETLLEAWRNAHKLRDPSGADRWLAAIARNVCRRWARRRGQESALASAIDAEPRASDGLDVAGELERDELAQLLDRALGLVPGETRDVLVDRYVHELPHAQIGERLGLSEDAVSMRLSRGKTVLRQVLASELTEEAAAYGLVDAPDGGWRETRVWCSECGRRKLLVRRDPPPGAVSFRCPGCSPDSIGSEYSLANPFFARLLGDLVRPTAMLARAADWSSRYFAAGADAEAVPCTRCGRPVTLRRFATDHKRHPALFAHCTACDETVSSSMHGLASALPEVRRFGREHPRLRLLPEREVESRGVPAIVVRHEDVLGTAGVDVVLARDTLRVLEVATG